MLISFWSYALAAALFAALVAWQLGAGLSSVAQRLFAAAYAMTALWAWIAAVGPGTVLAGYAETARNLVWIGILHHLWAASEDDDGPRERGVKMVYAAVAACLGLQVVGDVLPLVLAALPGNDRAELAALAGTSLLLRITAAAGALVLVHNLYGQAAPASRGAIRLAMLGLVVLWGYDLNFYTLAYLDPAAAVPLGEWRGLVAAATAPLFALDARRDGGWRLKLSRAATFQSLSLLAICGYFAVMAVLATALGEIHGHWGRNLGVALLAATTVAALVVLPSRRARGWAKVKLAKHLFEHRYDYRSEWLRFTHTLGRSGADAPPLGERVIKAFADIVDSPGGLLLVADEQGAIDAAADWLWPGPRLAFDSVPVAAARDFWHALEGQARLVDLDTHRRRGGAGRDQSVPVPEPLLSSPEAWLVVPLVHEARLAGLVLLAAPEYRRPLDWEDFDLLRTAGRQAASSLAEMHGQLALVNAQRFEEFNRRFAFILHDIKNLVSQLSLLSRNAERHADNAEFRADMIATLKSSVGKMNDLLARLSPQSLPRSGRLSGVALDPLLAALAGQGEAGRPVTLAGEAGLAVLADGPQLEQALAHLVQNAIDASPAGSGVTLRAGREDETVTLAVEDRGCGMSADFVRHRLFQPFASTKDGGFGVGAYEARALVTAMGGRLTVDSRPGHGSRFVIRLPAAPAAAAGHGTPAERKRA